VFKYAWANLSIYSIFREVKTMFAVVWYCLLTIKWGAGMNKETFMGKYINFYRYILVAHLFFFSTSIMHLSLNESVTNSMNSSVWKIVLKQERPGRLNYFIVKRFMKKDYDPITMYFNAYHMLGVNSWTLHFSLL
jgi:hypothetical protein